MKIKKFDPVGLCFLIAIKNQNKTNTKLTWSTFFLFSSVLSLIVSHNMFKPFKQSTQNHITKAESRPKRKREVYNSNAQLGPDLYTYM